MCGAHPLCFHYHTFPLITPNPDKPNYLPSSAHIFGIAIMQWQTQMKGFGFSWCNLLFSNKEGTVLWGCFSLKVDYSRVHPTNKLFNSILSLSLLLGSKLIPSTSSLEVNWLIKPQFIFEQWLSSQSKRWWWIGVRDEVREYGLSSDFLERDSCSQVTSWREVYALLWLPTTYDEWGLSQWGPTQAETIDC